jgi:hypothetical protein
MISSKTFNNVKYFSTIAILIIVFFILKFIIDIPTYEAILLACIIAVSILIIENIIYINGQVTDPLNCDQCKIQKTDNSSSNSNSNENFESIGERIMNRIQENSKILSNNLESVVDKILPETKSEEPVNLPTLPTQPNPPVSTSVPVPPQMQNNYEFKCVKVIKQDPSLVTQPVSLPTMQPNEILALRAAMNNASPNIAMDPNAPANISSLTTTIPAKIGEGFEMLDSPIDEQEQQEQQELQELPEKQINNLSKEDIKASIIAKINANEESNKPKNVYLNNNIANPSIFSIPNNNKELIDGTTDPIRPIDATFDSGYVKYQQDGMQALDDKAALKNNIFRASIGNQEVVQEYLQDGKKYYNDIFTWSTDAPKSYEALNSELKYGDYNYIGPLNKGMINKAYTFISPTNWYPIPPFPPVCVTNKRCTTSPVVISDGNDYMNFAALEDFDNARRFTGDMGINIDYIKNVLNNPTAY